jgi:hypothetical protein
MKFKTIDGQTVSIDLRKSRVCKQFQKTSKGQKQVGKHLLEIYQFDTIYEDFIIPKSNGLSLDFFIPGSKIAFEFNGIQHYQFSSFFHSDINDFEDQKKRDERKNEWCRVNEITLVEITDSKIYRKQLRELILKAIRKQSNS